MHKISRVYVANAGHRLAWYDGLLLDFTDVATGLPTHTIYNLVNQGGKTTFLSLVFSCIRTNRAEFLQTLSNPAQRFEHYFDEGGLPGFIAIEWQMPGDLLSPTRAVVTGQIVVRRPSDPLDADRWFFLMQDRAPGLGLEYLPAPNLKVAPEHIARNRDDVLDWLHRMRTEHGEQSFYYTQNQTEWEKALVSVTLDVDLIRNQVDFNRKEGSMDDAFLSFRDEREFVRRFLTLTLHQENADQVRETVATQARRLTQRKPLQESLAQLAVFDAAFTPFAAKAGEYGRTSQERARAARDLVDAAGTLALREREQHDRKQAFEQAAQTHHLAAEAADRRQASAHADERDAEYEALARSHRKAEERVRDATTALEEARRQLRLCEAAEALDARELLAQRLDGLTIAIEKANGDVAPLRAQAGQAAALLRERLRQARARELEEVRFCRERASAELAGLERLAEERTRLEGELRRAQERRAEPRAQLKHAAQVRARLVATSVLQAEETSQCALAQLRGQQAAAKAEGEQQEHLIAQSEAERGQIASRREAVAGERARAAEQARSAQTELDAGLTERERLRSDASLCAATQCEIAEPDSAALPSVLGEHIRRLEHSVVQAELDHARLQADLQSIHDTGLAGRDSEVTRLVRALADAGVKGAQSYPQYLAQVLPDAQAARAVVRSDPGRFLGVSVPASEQLEQVRQHLSQLPALARPVVVSIAADSPQSACVDRLVVGPADDTLYNQKAATALQAVLGEQLRACERSRAEARGALNAAQSAKLALEQYLRRFGQARLAALAQAVESNRDAAEQAQRELGVLKERSAQCETRIQQARSERQRCDVRLAKLNDFSRQLTEYRETLEAHLPRWQEQVQSCEAECERLEDLLEQQAPQRKSLEDGFRQAQEAQREHEGAARRLDEEATSLTQCDAGFDAGRALAARPQSLAELRQQHRLAQDALHAAERESTEPLYVQKRDVEEQLGGANQRLAQLSAGLELAQLRLLLGSDFAQLRATARRSLEEASDAQGAARTAEGSARARLEDFQNHHAQCVRERADLTALDDGALEQLRANAARARQAAETAAFEAARAREQARGRQKECETNAGLFQAGAKAIRSLLPPDAQAAVVPSAKTDWFLHASAAADEVAALVSRYQGLERSMTAHRETASRLFERVRAVAANDVFERTDPQLADILRRNTLEEALEDYERVQNGIVQRRECIEEELEKMGEDFERAIIELLQLVNDALGLLKRATEALRLPDDVPRVAGRTVLSMPRSLFQLTHEARRERLGPLLDRLAADGNVPENGAALATAAVMELGHGRLGLKLLKVVEIADEQYVPVEKLSRSGAESIAMAMLLYFVIARLRNEQRGQSTRRAGGGVLILDNPFSKATHRPVWEIIMGLARAMDLQLIITTGIQEYEALSVFKRFIRLAKTHQHSGTGRVHIQMADYNFKDEVQAA